MVGRVDTMADFPSPPFLPNSRPLALLDVFPTQHRSDPFRPMTPPEMTEKTQAQAHLRLARLSLLQKVGYRHPLMARVKVSGELKPATLTSARYYAHQGSHRNTARPIVPSRGSILKQEEQCPLGGKKALTWIKASKCGSEGTRLYRRVDTITTDLMEKQNINDILETFRGLQRRARRRAREKRAIKTCQQAAAADCKVIGWKRELRREIEMQRSMHNLAAYYETAVLTDELEPGMMFPMEM